jgi:hypothetical protein
MVGGVKRAIITSAQSHAAARNSIIQIAFHASEAILVRIVRAVLLAVVCFVFLNAPSTFSQNFPRPQMPPPIGGEEPRRSREERDIERKMEKERNKQRQEALKRDTDKLLDLATQLKQYVDKSNENVMSMDVIKKADEIEKLAKSVKDKMKGT